MRRDLICYEWPAQATRCRLSKYVTRIPTLNELSVLRDTLTRQTCQVQLIMSGDPPKDSLVKIRLFRVGTDELYIPPCLQSDSF